MKKYVLLSVLALAIAAPSFSGAAFAAEPATEKSMKKDVKKAMHKVSKKHKHMKKKAKSSKPYMNQ